jgi:hypothetical protein
MRVFGKRYDLMAEKSINIESRPRPTPVQLPSSWGVRLSPLYPQRAGPQLSWGYRVQDAHEGVLPARSPTPSAENLRGGSGASFGVAARAGPEGVP